MNFPAKQVTRRYAFVAFVLVVICIAVVIRAFLTMTVDQDYWMSVSKRFVKNNVEVPPTRGNILADNGEVLAASLPEYKMFMDFMSWEKNPKRQQKNSTNATAYCMPPSTVFARACTPLFLISIRLNSNSTCSTEGLKKPPLAALPQKGVVYHLPKGEGTAALQTFGEPGWFPR